MLKLIGFTAGGLTLAACGGPREVAHSPATGSVSNDYAARFAGYEVAFEPNGDPAKVVWPAFIMQAGPEVQSLYAFQIENGALMRYMPCFCGCGQSDGHRNNRDCYIKEVNPEGSVVFDTMAPT